MSYIAPAADNNNGVVTYAVRVSFPDNDPKVKVGMTADLKIVTAVKDNVLLVPNTALLPKGSGRVVQVPAQDAQGEPTTREVEVQTGLTDGTQTEITERPAKTARRSSRCRATAPRAATGCRGSSADERKRSHHEQRSR